MLPQPTRGQLEGRQTETPPAPQAKAQPKAKAKVRAKAKVQPKAKGQPKAKAMSREAAQSEAGTSQRAPGGRVLKMDKKNVMSRAWHHTYAHSEGTDEDRKRLASEAARKAWDEVEALQRQG